MKDITIFQTILGETTPWFVSNIEVDEKLERLTIEMTLKEDAIWGCPVCGERMHVHGYDSRTWRHLDTQSYKTFLTAQTPTVKCPTHGAQTVRVPWAETYSRFTMAFEKIAILLLQSTNTEQARKRLGISWDEADGIKQLAVARGLQRRSVTVMKHLCVDEKNAGAIWLTTVTCTDEGRARVVYMAEGRDQGALDPFWQSLNEEQLNGIESISADMAQAYTNSILQWVPDGKSKLVYDRFHVAAHMSKAVDEVRRQEQGRMAAEQVKAMKGSRFWWLYSPDHLPSKLKRGFEQLKTIAHKTAKAWELKELLRTFWQCPDEPTGRFHLREWLRRALRCSLGPVRRVARMCKERLENLLTFFAHRCTNASAESVNSRIQSLINLAHGYRNPKRLMADIYFHLGGLDLEPRFPQ